MHTSPCSIHLNVLAGFFFLLGGALQRKLWIHLQQRCYTAQPIEVAKQTKKIALQYCSSSALL